MKARPKYGNRKVQVDGVKFDSLKESRRGRDLRLMQLAGEIDQLQFHPKFELDVNGVHIARYIADSTYRDVKTGKRVIEDVKSEATAGLDVFRMKSRLMLACHGIEVKVYGVPTRERAA